ncbi:MAG: YjgP/YjgQ family permease [Candidatus Latescibacteria bacterium]|jgi:lipopolysaccharide export system permease protein|nr:YjgP/YjgQ family permease [Candidatus Latescibacterota bacterium]
MNIFVRYVIKEHIAPFFFAFFVIMFVLILKLMLELIDLLLSKGVGLVFMAQLLAYNLAWMIALVIPMSVLVASVMAFGRMGASNEIIAMKTAGISMHRIVSPVLFLGILLTLGMVWFNNNVLPEANLRAGSLKKAVFLKKPLFSLKNRHGQFVSDNDLPYTIHFSDIDNETEEIRSITLFQKGENNSQTIIIADRGKFITSPDRLLLVLKNGEIHQKDPKQEDRYFRSTFEQFTYVVKDIDFGFDTSYKSPRNDRNMPSLMMREQIKELEKMSASWEKRILTLPKNEPNREIQLKSIKAQIRNWDYRIASYLVEIHKKNSIPFAAIIFVLIGSSLGMLARRSGASIGIGMSIGFFTLYYMFLIGGESAGDRMIVAPWLAMWAPNIVLGAAGIAIFIYAARR